MCGENPQTKFEWHMLHFEEAGELLERERPYNFRETTPAEVAKILKTSCQVAGKVVRYYPELYTHKIRASKIIYVPKEST
jgi:hypothetical protein